MDGPSRRRRRCCRCRRRRRRRRPPRCPWTSTRTTTTTRTTAASPRRIPLSSKISRYCLLIQVDRKMRKMPKDADAMVSVGCSLVPVWRRKWSQRGAQRIAGQSPQPLPPGGTMRNATPDVWYSAIIVQRADQPRSSSSSQFPGALNGRRDVALLLGKQKMRATRSSVSRFGR